MPGDVVVASLGDEAPRACLVPPSFGAAVVKADCIRVRLFSALEDAGDATVPVLDLLTVSIGGVWGGEPDTDEVDVDVFRVTEFRDSGVIDPSTAARRPITAKQLASRELQIGDLLIEKSGGGPDRPVA